MGRRILKKKIIKRLKMLGGKEVREKRENTNRDKKEISKRKKVTMERE